jgi:hypothetical protein
MRGKAAACSKVAANIPAGLPVKETASVRPGPGAGRSSQRIHGRDLVIIGCRVAPELVVQTVPKNDRALLQISLNPRSELVFNGGTAGSSDLFVSAGLDGYLTTGEDRCDVAIGIRKIRLIWVCSVVAGIGVEDVRLRYLVHPREQPVCSACSTGFSVS